MGGAAAGALAVAGAGMGSGVTALGGVKRGAVVERLGGVSAKERLASGPSRRETGRVRGGKRTIPPVVFEIT